MTPTTFDDGISSEGENQSVADHSMPSETAVKHIATDEKLSRFCARGNSPRCQRSTTQKSRRSVA